MSVIVNLHFEALLNNYSWNTIEMPVNFPRLNAGRIQDFPRGGGGGGAPTPKGEHQPIIRLIFSENCMKKKKIGQNFIM